MAFWLVKSEPVKYGWPKMMEDKRTFWNGVRNYQASNNLKAMRMGEQAFFYHSNEDLAVVGVVEIAREYYPDPSDEKGRFGMVDVAAVGALRRPVTLAQIKADPAFDGIALIRQSRLSVMPIIPDHWARILELGGGIGP